MVCESLVVMPEGILPFARLSISKNAGAAASAEAVEAEQSLAARVIASAIATNAFSNAVNIAPPSNPCAMLALGSTSIEKSLPLLYAS